MGLLVWEIRKEYGWAFARGVPHNLVCDVCYVRQVDSGLWVGEYIADINARNYTQFPGEHSLEDLRAILETTIMLLETQQ